MGDRALLPVHTNLFRPWVDELSPTLRAELESRSHPLLADVLYLTCPWFRFDGQAIREAFFPAWNPYLLAGSPHFEQSATAFLYLPDWPVFLAPDPVRSLAWSGFLHVVAAIVFTFAFLRAIGCRPAAAVLGGMAFALGLWMSLRVEYPQGLHASIWLPLLLWGIEAVRAGKARRGMVALAVGVSLACLAGFIQSAVLSFGVAGAYACWRLLPRGPAGDPGGGGPSAGGPSAVGSPAQGLDAVRRRRCAWIAVATGMLCGILLAAPQILPTLSLMRSGLIERAALDATSARAQGIPLAALLGFLAPTLWGWPAWNHLLRSDIYRHNSLFSTLLWGPAAPGTPSDSTIELACFVGVTTVLLAGFCLRRGPRRRHAVFFLLVAAASLALATGSVLWIAAVHVPGVAIGSPKRWLFLVSFAVAMLGAIGFDNLHRLGARGRRRAVLAGLVVGLVAIGVAAAGWVGRESLAGVLVDWTSSSTGAPRGRVLALVPQGDFLRNTELLLGEVLRFGLVVLGLASVLWVGFGGKDARPEAPPAAVAGEPPVALPLHSSAAPSPPSRRARRAWAEGAVVAVLALELIRLWICFHPMPPEEGFFAPHRLFDRLQELSREAVERRDAGEAGGPDGSVDPSALHYGGGPRIARFGEPLADPDRHTLPLNVLGVYRLPDAQGYATLSLAPYEELWEAIEPREPGHEGITWGVGVSSLLREESLRSGLLDLLGVRFLVSFRAIPASSREGWRPRDRIGSLFLYENEEAFPRAFWVPRGVRVTAHEEAMARVSGARFPLDQAVVLDVGEGDEAAAAGGGREEADHDGPGHEGPGRGGGSPAVRLRRYEPNLVEVGIQHAPPGGYLVLADAWAPGWRAELRDEARGTKLPAEILRADVALRAVAIPEGSWILTMRYRPEGLLGGAWIAALAVVWLAWGCRPNRGGRHRAGDQARSNA